MHLFGGFPIPLIAGIFNSEGLGNTKQPASAQKREKRGLFDRGGQSVPAYDETHDK